MATIVKIIEKSLIFFNYLRKIVIYVLISLIIFITLLKNISKSAIAFN